MNHKPRVLFFSLSDSTRSQIAEDFLRTFAGDEFVTMSAATRSLEADPLAREVMQEVGIDISGQHAKDIKESLTEHFSYVVTVCDASREKFPLWPFTCKHHSLECARSGASQGTTERKRQVFRHVRDEISWRVREFLENGMGTDPIYTALVSASPVEARESLVSVEMTG
jgi:arsenate reductase